MGRRYNMVTLLIYGWVSLWVLPIFICFIPLMGTFIWLGFGILCFIGFYFLELRHNEDWNNPKVQNFEDIKHYEMTDEDKRERYRGFGEFWGER